LVEGSSALAGLEAGRDGDGEFEEFFDAMWGRATQVVTRMGLSREDAEDVVLDAMAVAYDRWSRVRTLPHRDGWLLKVAANRALRVFKKASRRRDDAALGVPIRLDEDVATRVSVRDGIARLPRRQRDVIALRYLADMPEEQIAAVLGLNIGTVKQHASRGRARLRWALDSQDGGGDRAV
jgi:RNA polymerase sigma factor (sigma-70 family)